MNYFTDLPSGVGEADLPKATDTSTRRPRVQLI